LNAVLALELYFDTNTAYTDGFWFLYEDLSGLYDTLTSLSVYLTAGGVDFVDADFTTSIAIFSATEVFMCDVTDATKYYT